MGSDELREDLQAHLENIGAYGKYYDDLVEDYIRLYEMKNMLWQDIQERGVTVEWRNSETSHGRKKNDSVNEYQKTNMQMLKIQNHLGINTKDLVTGGDEDVDDFFGTDED